MCVPLYLLRMASVRAHLPASASPSGGASPLCIETLSIFKALKLPEGALVQAYVTAVFLVLVN
jgi:hypothetical protein